MPSKLLSALAFAGAVIIALVFVKLMYDMNQSMEKMTGYVGAMSRDVAEMSDGLHSMNASMLRMEKSMQGMERSFNVGSEQIQQLNPAQLFQQMFQGNRQPTR